LTVFFENINHNDGKGAFTLTLFEMTIADCPGFHVPHCTYVRIRIFFFDNLALKPLGLYLILLGNFVAYSQPFNLVYSYTVDGQIKLGQK
jgi:hypothetical protein